MCWSTNIYHSLHEVTAMGLGPKGSSLLHKMGKKQAWEMSTEELEELVTRDQHRRSIQRAIGRVRKVLVDSEGRETTTKRGRPRTKSKVKKEPARLEDLGVAPVLAKKLRETGKPEFQIILELQAAGII
jgi:hypothetical protein